MFRAAALFATTLLAAPLAAQSLDDVVTVEVLPGWRAEGGRHVAAIAVSLAPGWKTYWRAPGDAGIPPHFDWRGSDNLRGYRTHWPMPEVFYQNGMRSIGYADSVVFPIEFFARSEGEAITLEGQAQLGVCEEICIPVALDITAELPPMGSPDPVIVAALVDRPKSAEEAGVTRAVCNINSADMGLVMEAIVTMPALGRGETAVIEAGDAAVWTSEPQIARDGDDLTITARMVHASGEAFIVDRSDVRITVFGGGQAVDIQGCRAG